MAQTVFVCHSAHDKQVADAACAALEARRIPCWIAPRDVLPGDEWGKAIVDAIGECRILVLIFSTYANTSPQVRREVERAVSKGRIILPFRIQDVMPSDAMEYALGNTHWLDALTPPLEAHLVRLADTVLRILERDAPAAPLFPQAAAIPIPTPPTPAPQPIPAAVPAAAPAAGAVPAPPPDAVRPFESDPAKTKRGPALAGIGVAAAAACLLAWHPWSRGKPPAPQNAPTAQTNAPMPAASPEPSGPSTPAPTSTSAPASPVTSSARPIAAATPPPQPTASADTPDIQRYRKACDSGDGDACDDLGDIYEKGKGVPRDYAKAIQVYRKSCDGGHQWGCYLLDQMYELGEGGPALKAQTIAAHVKACDGGSSDDCENLGMMYFYGLGENMDRAHAAMLFRNACDGGNAIACEALGDSFENGWGVPVDKAQAFTLYRKACDGRSELGCEGLKRLQP